MAEPKTWHWEWKEKANPQATGTYESTGVDLQTEENVRTFVATYFKKLDVVAVHEGPTPGTPTRSAVNPEHYMHGTMDELRADVKAAQQAEADTPR